MCDKWDDEWDDGPTNLNTNNNVAVDVGHGFNRGRGFTPFLSDNQYDDQDQHNGFERRGGRGGRGRGRGGRGGGGREPREDYDASGGGDNEHNNERGHRGRGRGGGGWGRGGRRDSGGEGDSANKVDENSEVKKPPVTYVPPEPTTNEDEMFGSSISSGIHFEKLESVPVKVTGNDIPDAIKNFEAANLRKLVLDNINKSQYRKPTPIQKHAIPIALAGRDIMACAQTGSGKTAAFLLPIINTLLDDPRDLISEGICAQPQVVILSPTRELTLQIFNEARKFSHGSILKVVVAYGGTAVRHQADNVSKGCHILVATPGRLHDFVERRRVSFQSIRFVVLDEADRMLDMGFLPGVEKLMEHSTMVSSSDRQTLMFSATFPEPIQHIADRFLNNYLFIAVGIIGGASTEVDQEVCEVTKYDKVGVLKKLVSENDGKRILIFVETKRNADFLACLLSEEEKLTTSIHGDREQSEREEALFNFKTGRHSILVATGVAARGLDIKNVDIVVNFDLPKSIDEYVHRIGRTGRVGNTGKAISFYDSSKDVALTSDLAKILDQAGQTVPEFLKLGGSGSSRFNNRYGGSDIRTHTQTTNVNGDEPAELW